MAYDELVHANPAVTISHGSVGDIFNGSTSGYWSSSTRRCGSVGGHSGDDDDPKDNVWIQFDFGETVTLDKITGQWRSSEYIDPFAVFTSDDGSTWSKVGAYAGQAGGGTPWEASFDEAYGRYWAVSDQAASAYLIARGYWFRFYGIVGGGGGGGGGGGRRWALDRRTFRRSTRRF